MSRIKIDNQEYEFEMLSAEAKEQLASIQFVDTEVLRLKSQLAVLQTARLAYSKALSDALSVVSGETIKF